MVGDFSIFHCLLKKDLVCVCVFLSGTASISTEGKRRFLLYLSFFRVELQGHRTVVFSPWAGKKRDSRILALPLPDDRRFASPPWVSVSLFLMGHHSFSKAYSVE